MESIPIPKTLTLFQLMKQDGLMLSPVGFSSAGMASLGIGFFLTEKEAEYHRTLESIREEKYQYHIFALEIPNPAYKE